MKREIKAEVTCSKDSDITLRIAADRKSLLFPYDELNREERSLIRHALLLALQHLDKAIELEDKK